MSFARTLARGAARGLKVVDDTFVMEGENASERIAHLLSGGPTLAGPVMSPDAALRIIAINAAVNLKCNATRSIPLAVYQSTEDGFHDYAKGRKSRYFSLLHESPNPEQPADELWAQIAGHLAHRRNAYLWKEKHEGGVRDGLVKGLWAIDPRRVKVTRVDGERVWEISQRTDGPSIDPARMRADEIIHVRSGPLAPNGLVALSPIDQCRQALGVHAATGDYLARHLGGGANFAGYLYNDDTDVEVDDDEKDRIEQKLIAPGRGSAGVNTIPFFDARVKWQPIGMSLADQQFMELMGWGVADCALLMGVPPTLLNAPIRSSSLTYRTTAEEDQRFLKYGVSPDLTAVESALRVDNDLFRASEYVPEFRREAHLQMDTIGRYNAHALAIRAGWKTPNEVRRAENMPAQAGGDELVRLGAKPADETRALLDLLDDFDGPAASNGAHALN